MTCLRVADGRTDAFGARVVELVCESAMQIGEELRARRVGARPGGLQVDRGADLRGLEVIRPERPRSPAPKQVLDIPA